MPNCNQNYRPLIPEARMLLDVQSWLERPTNFHYLHYRVSGYQGHSTDYRLNAARRLHTVNSLCDHVVQA